MYPATNPATFSSNELSLYVISYPYNKEGQSGNAQVDFMIVKDIDFAKKVLDEDHYGLQKVKERIIEFVVMKFYKK